MLQEGRLRTLDLCLRLDHPAPHPSVSSVSHLPLSSPQTRPVNPALLVTLKNLLGEDAVTDSVIEQELYFIGKLEELSMSQTFSLEVLMLI